MRRLLPKNILMQKPLILRLVILPHGNIKDKDGSKLRTLLAEHHLYAFGTRATVKKWKQHNNKPKDPDDDDDDKVNITQPHPPLPTSIPKHPQPCLCLAIYPTSPISKCA